MPYLLPNREMIRSLKLKGRATIITFRHHFRAPFKEELSCNVLYCLALRLVLSCTCVK